MFEIKAIVLLAVTVLLGSQDSFQLQRIHMDGAELGPSLQTRRLGEQPIRHVPAERIQSIPQVSSDPLFVKTIARAGSQGNLEGEGVVAALFALYDGENELGFYGFEAESEGTADRLESQLRHIWKHNVSLDRAQIHRGGLVVLVVWTDGLSPAHWEQANQAVSERLRG